MSARIRIMAYLMTHRALWWLVLVACVLFLVLVVIATLTIDQTNQSAIADFLRAQTQLLGLKAIMTEIGTLAANDALLAVIMSGLSAFISLSLIYIYKIPDIRRVGIYGIAYGYFENFLRKLILHCVETHTAYRIVIVLPTATLLKDPEVYIADLRRHIANLGYSMQTVQADEKFGRHAFFIQRKENPPLPIYVDVPTTLRSLIKILELEASTPVGQLSDPKWEAARFVQLRNDFATALKSYLQENSWGNVVFVDAENQAECFKTIEQEAQALEAVLARDANQAV